VRLVVAHVDGPLDDAHGGLAELAAGAVGAEVALFEEDVVCVQGTLGCALGGEVASVGGGQAEELVEQGEGCHGGLCGGVR
jgi:hypothetical protein